jgi:uncharacterized membrane protein YdbT with pleckstrin-like domain
MAEKKAFKGQYDDEEVLYVFRKHPVVMRKGLILFMLAILLGTVPSFIKPELSYFYAGIGGGIILGLILWMPSWIYWYFSVYIITDQRFIQNTQKGFFHRSVSDIGINHIQSVNFQVSGIQETLLGFGSVLVQTYLGDMLINNVHHPEKVANELFRILREYGDVVDPKIEDVGQITGHN